MSHPFPSEKPTDALLRELLEALDTYEEYTRNYIRKAEDDRPAVAEALWDAVWEFRKTILFAHVTLRHQLAEAKFKKDPG